MSLYNRVFLESEWKPIKTRGAPPPLPKRPGRSGDKKHRAKHEKMRAEWPSRAEQVQRTIRKRKEAERKAKSQEAIDRMQSQWRPEPLGLPKKRRPGDAERRHGGGAFGARKKRR